MRNRGGIWRAMRSGFENKRIRILVILFVFGGAMLSCNDNALVDKNVAIDGHTWDYENKPHIEVEVTDNSQRYDVFLNFRHTSQYPYSNVFILMHQQHPSGFRDTTRVEIRLAEPDGRWLGKGTGSVFNHQQKVKSNYVFPDTGRYVFSFEQNMRENPLPAVSDIGLRVAPQNNP